MVSLPGLEILHYGKPLIFSPYPLLHTHTPIQWLAHNRVGLSTIFTGKSWYHFKRAIHWSLISENLLTSVSHIKHPPSLKSKFQAWGGGRNHPNNRAAKGIFPFVLYRPQERGQPRCKYPTNEMKGSRLSAVGLIANSRPLTNEINMQPIVWGLRDPHLAAHHLELIMFEWLFPLNKIKPADC